jgi:hypothetical protein
MSAERAEAESASRPPVPDAVHLATPEPHACTGECPPPAAEEVEYRVLVGSLARWLDLNA